MPTLDIEVRFIIYLYGQNQRLVISDIDGTITTSNIQGFILPQLGIDAAHDDVVRLLDSIGDRGYTVMYLTARSMGWDQQTREYLFEVSLLTTYSGLLIELAMMCIINILSNNR